jgi:hypothetical protein
MQKITANLPIALKPAQINQLVRLGSVYDGGYILSAGATQNIETILTFGLGLNWDFERDMVRVAKTSKIHCYDHTVTLEKLRRKFIKAKLMRWRKPEKYDGYIRAYEDYQRFFQTREGIKHWQMMVAVDDGVGQTSVSKAIERLSAQTGPVMLKCDIEGAEYEVANAIVAAANQFSIIAIEFHDVAARIAHVLAIMDALGRTHVIDHVHVNNMSKMDAKGTPSVIEVSLSARGLPAAAAPAFFNDHGLKASMDGSVLDQPNAPDRADIAINYI